MLQQRNKFEIIISQKDIHAVPEQEDHFVAKDQQMARLYSSEKIIMKSGEQNKTFGNNSHQNMSETQIMNHLNMSLEGLFSKIEALKDQSTLADPPKENNPQGTYNFPKFSPFPTIKTPKSTLNAKSFDQFFEKFKPLGAKDVGPKIIQKFSKKQVVPQNGLGLFKKGLLDIPNLKASMQVTEDMLTQPDNDQKLENLIIKEVKEEQVQILKSCIFQKPLSVQDFELGACVGSGKFGDVFVCRHRLTGCLFALKKIFKSTIKEYNMVSQFTKELKIHYQLDHPHIVKLYTHFSDEYHVFLLMEYVEGGILMEKLKSSQQAISRYVSETIEAVEHLHRLNIAHRDIKPQNIVLQFNTVKLCDFGWSAFYGKEMKKTFCGTLDYLSPEMKGGDSYDNSVDIWAIGVLTFELLTGVAPFKKELANWKEKGFERGFNNNKWHVIYPPFISTASQSFMRNILKENPSERAPLRVCSNHLFIRKYRVNPQQLQFYEEFVPIIQ